MIFRGNNYLNPLNATPTKVSTPQNDHFVGLTLTGLRIRVAFNFQTDMKSSKIVLNRNAGNKLVAYKYVL